MAKKKLPAENSSPWTEGDDLGGLGGPDADTNVVAFRGPPPKSAPDPAAPVALETATVAPRTAEAPAWRARPFDRLAGNAKGVFDEVLAPLTLWVGRNQTGKSSRIIAARYALLGPKGWGLGAHGSAIAGALAPGAVDEFYAELSGPDGDARFTVRRDGEKWQDPDTQAHFSGALSKLTAFERECVVPIVTMSTLLQHGTTLARRALMRRFCDLSMVPTPEDLLPEQKTSWDAMRVAVTKELTRAGEAPDPVEVLEGMEKAFERAKRAANARVKALDEVLRDKKSTALSEAGGAEMRPQLETALAVAQAWESAEHLRARMQALEAAKEAYRIQAEGWEANRVALEKFRIGSESENAEQDVVIGECNVKLVALGEEVLDLTQRLGWGKNLVEVLHRARDHAKEHEASRCPICSSPFDPEKALEFIEPIVQKRTNAITEKQNARDAILTQRQAAQGIKSENMATLAKSTAEYNRAIGDLQRKHAEIVTAEKEVTAALAASQSPATYAGKTAAELKVEITSLEQAKARKAQLVADGLLARKAEKESVEAKQLELTAKRLGDEAVARVQRTAEMTVNQYMPDGLAARLDLDKMRWAVLDKYGEPRARYAFCGYEEDTLVVALAAAYVEQSPLRVLTLDDADIKGVGLENVVPFFSALSRAVERGWLTQVLVAGNRLEPKLDELRALGWLIHFTDERALEPVTAPTPLTPPTGEPFVIFDNMRGEHYSIPDGAPALAPDDGPTPDDAPDDMDLIGQLIGERITRDLPPAQEAPWSAPVPAFWLTPTFDVDAPQAEVPALVPQAQVVPRPTETAPITAATELVSTDPKPPRLDESYYVNGMLKL